MQPRIQHGLGTILVTLASQVTQASAVFNIGYGFNITDENIHVSFAVITAATANKPLFSRPLSCGILIPPARRCIVDPAPGKSLADIGFPLRLSVGAGNLLVQGYTVTILISDKRLGGFSVS